MTDLAPLQKEQVLRGLPQPGEARPARRREGFWRRFFSLPAAVFGLLMLLFLIAIALSAPLIAPGDPFATSDDVLLRPSAQYPFGTDDLGRDVFRAVIHGARTSLLVGLLAAGSALALGVLIGASAGYAGGLLDDALMRITEMFQIVPRFFLVLVIVSLLGSNLWLVILLLGLTFWPGIARLLRGQVLSIRSRDYVLAARAIGVPEHTILVRHVLPGALPPIITQAALLVGSAIVVEAGLSFLGLGDRSVVSWGALLNDAQQFVRTAWWMSVFPGLAITMTVLTLNLIADGINEAWDPRLQS